MLATAILCAPGGDCAASAPPPSPIHAGPIFTQNGTSGAYPTYPRIQVQIEVPPGTDPKLVRPDAFFLSIDGGNLIGADDVQTLAATGYGISASFALDVSGSMKGAPLNAVRAGLVKFVDDAGPQDKMAIETIANDGRWDADWDASRDQVRTSLTKLAVRGSLTRLWDGLLQSIQRYPETPLSKRLIVISDGHDEGSVHHEEEVIAAAREHGIVIDAIGMTRSSPVYLQALNRLATETGGLFRQARDTAELEGLISHGVERLKSTPVVSFRLDNVKADNDSHRFEVTWKHEGRESKAETTSTLPKKAGMSKQRKFWLFGGAAAVLLLGAIILLSTRKRKPPFTPTPEVAAKPHVAMVMAQPQTPESARGRTFAEASAVGRPASPLQPAASTPLQVAPRPAAKRASTVILARFSSPTAEVPGAWLFCETGPSAGRQYPLSETEYWIGALENNHLQIPGDATVSGNHACFAFDHDLLSVYDNNSTNGTWVNDEQIRGTRKLLRPDDRVRIGQSNFSVEAVPRHGTSA